MTIVIQKEEVSNKQVKLVNEGNVLYIRVYESYGGKWHKVKESLPYASESKAKITYRRYVKKYVGNK